MNDRGAFRSDRRVNAHVSGQRPVWLLPESHQVQMQQARADHLVDSFFRNADAGGAFQFPVPIGPTHFVAFPERLCGQFCGPLPGDGFVRNVKIHLDPFPGLEQYGEFFVAERFSFDFGDTEYPVFREKRESFFPVELISRSDIQVVSGHCRAGSLDPGVTGNGSFVFDFRPDVEDGFLVGGRDRGLYVSQLFLRVSVNTLPPERLSEIRKWVPCTLPAFNSDFSSDTNDTLW